MERGGWAVGARPQPHSCWYGGTVEGPQRQHLRKVTAGGRLLVLVLLQWLGGGKAAGGRRCRGAVGKRGGRCWKVDYG